MAFEPPVLGIGPGIIILALIWFLAFIGAVVLARRMGLVGALIPMVLAIVITLILTLMPRKDFREEAKKLIIVDTMFIPKTIVLIFTTISFCAAVALWCSYHAAKPVLARPVKVEKFRNKGQIETFLK